MVLLFTDTDFLILCKSSIFSLWKLLGALSTVSAVIMNQFVVSETEILFSLNCGRARYWHFLTFHSDFKVIQSVAMVCGLGLYSYPFCSEIPQ